MISRLGAEVIHGGLDSIDAGTEAATMDGNPMVGIEEAAPGRS